MRPEHLVHLVLLAALDYLVALEFQGQVDHQDFPDSLGPVVHLVQEEVLELLEVEDQREQLDRLVPLELLDPLDFPDPLEQEGLQDCQAPLVCLVLQERQDR